MSGIDERSKTFLNTNRMIARALCAAFVLVLLVGVGMASEVPVEEWNKTFGGAGGEFGDSVQQTSDNGYVITGQTDSYGAGGSDFWLVKTDASGNETWNKTFGGAGNDYGRSVQQTSDGGYVMTGETTSYGAGGLWLVKTDASGNETWNKTFGGTGGEGGMSVQQTSDGGYVMTGYTYSYGAGSDDFWLVKADAAGNETWNKTFGGGGSDHGRSVQQTFDGGYVITGRTDSYGAGSDDFWLVKTDAAGNETWNKTFGDAGGEFGASVQQTSDGGYVITGGEWGGMGLVKTDASGNETWNKTFGSAGNDWGMSVQQTFDGGYVITGAGAGSGDLWLVKTDASGNETWNKTFGDAAYEQGMSVQQTSEGGYVMTGYTYSYGAVNGDFWLVKVSGTSLAIPPPSVTNLMNISYARTYINWTWTDPVDSNFSKVMIYLNGTFQTNVTNGTQYYNATGLALNTSYEISTHTVHTSGNINQTWKNHTAKTAPGTVHNINQGIDYLSIQPAIDGASTGDEIHVDSGIYYENVNVSRQVILIGVNTSDGKPVVDAETNGNAITLSANGITLDGFTAINTSNPYAGIRINSDNNILIDNNASNNNNGIHLENSDNNNITGNIASNNEVSGIRLSISNSNTILSNIFSSNSNNGIHITSSNSNTVSGNTVTYNYYGIAIANSNSNTISNNTVSFNDFISLFLQSSIDNTIYNNLFNNNMGPSTLGYNSNLLNTTKTAGTNIIGGLSLGGNLWANPSGTGFSQTCADANNDWICDTSYTIASENIDYHPLVQPGYINGTVMNNSIGIAGAVVTTNTSVTAIANASGVYSLLLSPGAYNFTVTKDPEYYSNSSVVVNAVSGSTAVQDIELVKKSTGTISGNVTSASL